MESTSTARAGTKGPNKALLVIMIVLMVAAIAFFVWDQLRQQPPTEPATASAPEVVAPPTAPFEPTEPGAQPEHYPIPSTPASAASKLPALDASDGALGDALAGLMGVKSLPEYFYPEQMIRRFVVTVDNLPRRKAASHMMPVKPVAGTFTVNGDEDHPFIDPANAARYDRYVAVMQSVKVQRLVDVYVRFYPLFQQAYVDLGYPNGYFNDRLVQAIDNLLAAPEAPAQVALARPNVMYLYADRRMESLSAGQKILVRMGNANAEKVKVVLAAIRSEVLRRAPGK